MAGTEHAVFLDEVAHTGPPQYLDLLLKVRLGCEGHGGKVSKV